MPLPPYIHENWKTAIVIKRSMLRKMALPAAPTAGLISHLSYFKIEAKGVELVYLTLHVGLGTFRPISVRMSTNMKCTQSLPSAKKLPIPSTVSRSCWRSHCCSRDDLNTNTGNPVINAMVNSKPTQAGPIFYQTRLSIHSRRCIFNQLPPSKVNLGDVGFSLAGREFVLNAYKRRPRTLPLLQFRRCHVRNTTCGEIIVILRLLFPGKSLLLISTFRKNPPVVNWWIILFISLQTGYCTSRNKAFICKEDSWFPCSMIWPSLGPNLVCFLNRWQTVGNDKTCSTLHEGSSLAFESRVPDGYQPMRSPRPKSRF